jgi:hypothetical protein
MNDKMKRKIIEKWMEEAYPQMSDIYDLELAEGISYIRKLKRLLDITENECATCHKCGFEN